MLYDTHCHLNYHTDEELKEITQRAKEYGVRYVMQAGARVEEINREVDICNKFSDDDIKIFCALANHPEYTKKNISSTEDLLKTATSDEKIKAIGETGLDTHIQENEEFLNDQIKSFENHIEASLMLSLPLIIHARGDVAISKCIEMLKFYKKDNVRFVMHSYTGDIDNAKKALDMGGFVSFSGIVTFKHAENVRDVAKIVPIENMFVETDAPFIAPTPMRGKQNETGFVSYTAKFLSDFLQIDYNEFCDTTTRNAKKFFQHE